MWNFAERVKVATGVRRNFSRGATSTFCWPFSVCWRCNANGRSQNVLLCFYATKKIPRESTRSIRIHFEIFWKWSCGYTNLTKKVYYLSSVTTFAELAHKSRCHCELHTNESHMDLNYQQLRLRLSHLSVLVEQNSLLKSFVQIVFYTSTIRNAFAFRKCLISIFASTFYKQVTIKRTINAQISICGEKSRKLDTLVKLFHCILTRQSDNIKNVQKSEHHAGVIAKRMNYENSPGWI